MRTNEGKGPVPLRDLEVLWETNEITNQTFVWRNGMTEWKKIMDLPDLQKKIYGLYFLCLLSDLWIEDTYVPFNPINRPILQNITKDDVTKLPDEPQKVGTIRGGEKKDEPEEELDSLEKKFEKIKQNLQQGNNEVRIREINKFRL